MCDAKYEDNLVNDFLPSLRNEGGYDGNIVILDYGLVFPTDWGVHYIKCEPLADFNNTVNMLRANYLLAAIAQYPESSQVAYFDCGDLWFQGSIEELFHVTGVGLAKERERWLHPWCQGVLESISDLELKKKMRTVLEPQIMRNAGVFVGDRETIITLLSKQVELTLNLSSAPFAVDQAIYNYLGYAGEVKVFDLPRKYNFVTQAYPWYLRNGKLHDRQTRELVTVVHNAGRRAAPRLYKPNTQTNTHIDTHAHKQTHSKAESNM